MNRIISLIVLIAACVAWVNVHAEIILVLCTHNTGPYGEVINSFTHAMQSTRNDVTIKVQCINETYTQEKTTDLIRHSNASVVLSLGAAATDKALISIDHTPLVYSMLLKPLPSQLTSQHGKNIGGIILDYALEDQFEFVKQHFPTRKVLGVLYNPEENGDKIAHATLIAKDYDLRIHAVAVNSPRDIPDALQSLSRNADIIWGITDSVAYSAITANAVLLTSLKNRIPLIGLSPSWVRAGALFSFSWDYEALGRQSAAMVLELLQGKSGVVDQARHPSELKFTINLRTARHLKIELPEPFVTKAQEVFE